MDDWDDRSSVTIQLPVYQPPKESVWPTKRWVGTFVAAVTALGAVAELLRRLLLD